MSNRFRLASCGLLLIVACGGAAIAEADLSRDQRKVVATVESRGADYAMLALELWELAEVGYQEYESSRLLQDELRASGFTVEAGVAGIPTAFIASYGSGSPVIGILAEFDALPGITQQAVPERAPREGIDAGHACGHHLFGTASVAAAGAIASWLETSRRQGTIRVYGTPAEEGGSGKVYLTRAGLFDDCDVVLHWHPSDRNRTSYTTTLANKSAKFRFHGHSAHAAGAPERGRSALDAVEAMNFLVNMMREHVDEPTRIHYVITRGGEAPNVVPDFAEVYYYVRHPEAEELQKVWDRVVQRAEAAALGTETRLEYEIIHGNQSVLPNQVLADVIDGNLRDIGGVQYDAEEQLFAERIYATFESPDLEIGTQESVQPMLFRVQKGSTDVGDVSRVCPTGGFNAATWVPGTAAHSWQAIAAGGTSIGTKGMMVAAKTLAITAVDLYRDPGIVRRAENERLDRVGEDFRYEALLGDRDPPLDYRN